MSETSHITPEKYQRFGKGRADLLKENPDPNYPFPSNERRDEQILNIMSRTKIRLKVKLHIENIEEKQVDEFYIIAASTLWDVCRLLQIPIPHIELSAQWNDRHGRKRHLNADGEVNPRHYAIRISPDYIAEIFESFSDLNRYDLVSFIYHETYHLWQNVHFNTRQNNPKNQSMRDEYAAQIFEYYALRNITPETHRQYLIKMILLALKRFMITMNTPRVSLKRQRDSKA